MLVARGCRHVHGTAPTLWSLCSDQARVRLKVRKSLLHWRHCTLRRSFVQLIWAVYATKAGLD